MSALLDDEVDEGVDDQTNKAENSSVRKAKAAAKSLVAGSPLRRKAGQAELDLVALSPTSARKRKQDVALANRSKLPEGQKKCGGCKKQHPVEMFA